MDSTTESASASDSGETGDTDDTTDIPPTSPACGMAAGSDWYAPYEVYWGEQTLRAEVDAGGVTREYIVEIPEPYDPNTPYPVVFTFHGLGALMDNAYGQHVANQWGQQVVAVYPQGLDNTWDLSAGGVDVSMFTGILNQLGNELCLDMRRIFVQGTSMGGGMTNFLACVMGDLVAGAGPTASWFPISADQCVAPVPVFVIHGMNDPTVSFNSGVQARDTWLSINGCSSESSPHDPSPCVIYDDCDSGVPVVWCAHDGGHDLPGVQGLDDDMMSFFMGLE
jgi:poly(3-hydroxybutyrate) depolymerase